mmetsp:Transcript_44320/g.94333  ORF Transcript_44320/g.94333 Transcript_44320/m.94333 type:complete len:105 (+) Transcript_44320:211-525(+)
MSEVEARRGRGQVDARKRKRIADGGERGDVGGASPTWRARQGQRCVADEVVAARLESCCQHVKHTDVEVVLPTRRAQRGRRYVTDGARCESRRRRGERGKTGGT